MQMNKARDCTLQHIFKTGEQYFVLVIIKVFNPFTKMLN